MAEVVLLEFEDSLKPLYKKMSSLGEKDKKERTFLQKDIREKMKKIYSQLGHWDRTLIARHPNRPYAKDYISILFDDVVYLSGDRQGHDDGCTIGALGKINKKPFIIVGQQKGRTLEENLKYNFGMPKPEGYRKALRLFKIAEKFGLPIITLIDTPGAYPGIEGEERSQSEAIARNLKEMGNISSPIISIIIGEGGSGGALGLAIANHVHMLENSIYSVISPESCASILWKDVEKKKQAAKLLSNDAQTAKKFNVIDEIIDEGVGGAHRNWLLVMRNVKSRILQSIEELSKFDGEKLKQQRFDKFSKIGYTKKLK